MRFLNVRSLVGGAMGLVLSAGLANAANSPTYDSWAKVKPGSSVTMKTSSEASGQKTQMEITYTLDQVTDDKAVLQVKTSMVVAGNKMDLPAQKMEIPKGTGAATPPATPAPTPNPNVKQSEEKVTVGGKSYTCQVTESTSDTNGMKVASKTWTCADVPNMIVKSESSTTGTVASKTTMELSKIEIK